MLRRAFRSLENPAVPISSTALAGLLGLGANNTGVTVTAKSSMGFSAVFRGVSVLSGLSAALPLHAFANNTLERRTVRILENPHPDMTPFELWRMQYAQRVLWGNSYALKVRNLAGAIAELWPIAPERVKVALVAPTSNNPSGKLFIIDGDTNNPLTPYDILHIPGLQYDGCTGVSPIRLAATSVGMALAAEEYGARLFGSGSLLSGILQTEQRLDQGQADRLKQSWTDKVSGLSNAHQVAILDSGAKFESISMPNTDAQFIESRDFQVSEVSRFLGLPPFLLMQTSKSTSWGTGLEQQAIGFVKFDLHPQWLKPAEARVTKELTGAGIYAKYRVDGLLRGDSAARSAFYNVMRQVGAYSANDIRDLEDLPPVEGGDTYLQPMNMEPLGSQTPVPLNDDDPEGEPDAS